MLSAETADLWIYTIIRYNKQKFTMQSFYLPLNIQQKHLSNPFPSCSQVAEAFMLESTTGSVLSSLNFTWRWSTAPTGSWRLPGKLEHPCFVTHRPPSISEQKEAKPKPYVDRLSRHGMRVGKNWSSIAELADRGFFNSTPHPTLWLNSTMFSSDSCFSEILGLGKHVCYADSRTTNFTRLTSPPSVRLCTASMSYFFHIILHLC